MSKRYTDPEKWNDDWYIELSPQMKVAWMYLCDNCSWGGFWKVSKRIYEVHTGCSFDTSEILSSMDGRVVDIGNGVWHIPSFVKFQQGTLKAGSRFHDSIISEIEKYIGNNKPLASPLQAPYKGLCNGNGNGNGDEVLPLGNTNASLWNSRHMEFLTAGPQSWMNYEMQSYRQWCSFGASRPDVDADSVIASAKAFRAYTASKGTKTQYVTKPHNFIAQGAYGTDWEKEMSSTEKPKTEYSEQITKYVKEPDWAKE